MSNANKADTSADSNAICHDRRETQRIFRQIVWMYAAILILTVVIAIKVFFFM